jgi:hypothetical protein
MEDLAPRMFAILPVVIVVIPVALGAPTMLVFIPPATIVAPTVVARLAQFASRVICLAAVATVVFNSFVKMMIGLRDSFLATVFSGPQTRSAAEEQKSRQHSTSQRYFSRPKNSGLKYRLHPVLLYL